MEWLEILHRIKVGKDRHTEFKRGLDLSDIGKTICAFANTEGGALIIGVTTARDVVGVEEDSEQVQERLTAFLHTGCSTPVFARTGRHEDSRGWVHWVDVPRQRNFEPLCYDGRVWIRRERSSVEPSPTELQELYNTFGYILTEERAIHGAAVDHIDMHSFRSYLNRLGFDTEEDPQPHRDDDLRNRGVLIALRAQGRGEGVPVAVTMA